MLMESLPPLNDNSTLRPIKFANLRFARGDDFLYRFDRDSIDEARSLGADVLVFCDRPWLGESVQFPLTDRIEIALLSFRNFDEWFNGLKKDTRNEIRKGSKRGVETKVVEKLSVSEAQEIVSLFRESPFREGRYFEGYHHWTLKRVMESFKTNDGFKSVPVNYNYVLLTRKAKVFAKFKIYQPRDLNFSTKLRFVVPLSIPLQKHIPIRLIQKLHLYA